MGYLEGVWWSLAAAVAHSLIDTLRKLGSQKMAPLDLVALVTVYDALFATLGVLAVEGTLPDPSAFTDSKQFLVVVFITSSIAVVARLLYQRALSIAPLSLTVPYLAFTPAFVVLVSPIFLAGEVPSPLGMLGVFIVSISGYMLGLVSAPSKCDQPSSPSKAKLPLLASSVQKQASVSALQQNQQEYVPQHHHNDLQLDTLQTAQHAMQQRQQQHDHIPGDQQYRHTSGDASRERACKGKSKSSHLSVWAMAYYKGKTQQSLTKSGLHNGDYAPPGHVDWLPSNPDIVVAADSLNDSHSVMMNGATHRVRTSIDSQAKVSKDYKADKAAGARAAAATKAAKLLTDAVSSRVRSQTYTACLAVLSGPNAAPTLVLTVAFLYSVTASLDKLGIAAAGHNLAAYFLGQRLLLGLFGAVYLLSFGRSALRHMLHDMVLLCGISLSELAGVVFYLVAINNILVSYVVAIKRVNVLLSTLIGCVLFREHVRKRIPYIIAMLCGMLMIVLQPGHESLHHSHHTRHHQHHLLMLL